MINGPFSISNPVNVNLFIGNSENVNNKLFFFNFLEIERFLKVKKLFNQVIEIYIIFSLN